ncbi:MAG: hypothetical protein ACE5D4_02185 [Thermodesulfobacteriota bacterium]
MMKSIGSFLTTLLCVVLLSIALTGCGGSSSSSGSSGGGASVSGSGK